MNPAEIFTLSVTERLEAAAREIFLLFQRSVAQYEEQIERQQRLLDVVWKPRVKLHRIDFHDPSESEEKHQQEEEEDEEYDAQLKEMDGEKHHEQLEEKEEDEEVFGEQQPCDLRHQERKHEVKPEPPVMEEEMLEVKQEMEEEYEWEKRFKQLKEEKEIEALVEQDLWKDWVNPQVKPEPLAMEVKQESDDIPVSFSHEGSEDRRVLGNHNRRVDMLPQLSPAAEGQQNQPPAGPAVQASGLNGVHLGTTAGNGSQQIPKRLTHKAPGSGTQEETHICTVCNGVFSSEIILADHRREIHADEKPFKCQTCGKSFRTSGYLRSHSSVHMNTSCPHTGCGKVFMKIRHLKNHMVVHSNHRPHQCNTCGKRFRRSDYLQNHIRTHTGERPHSCNFCGKTFMTKSSLKLHQLIHTSDELYKCKLCGQRFNLLHYLNIHHRRRHAGQAMSYQVIQHSGAQPKEKEPSGPSGGR